jgi:6-phosphogluconolactonase
VLAGGSTPAPVYRQLGSAFRDGVSWPAVHAFWGDERYVPHTDARSNYRMAQEALLASVPIQAGHVHPMPTHFPRRSHRGR